MKYMIANTDKNKPFQQFKMLTLYWLTISFYDCRYDNII